jgi:hypothetical protein
MSNEIASAHLFTFDELVEKVSPGFGAKEKWKIVRHKQSGIDLVDLYYFEKKHLEYYQRYQGADTFANCDGILSCLGTPNGRALFFGAYRIEGMRKAPMERGDQVPTQLRQAWDDWRERNGDADVFCYDLQWDRALKDLEMRPVIDWGKGTRSWAQWNLQKPVVALQQPGALGACPDHLDIDLSLSRLRHIQAHELVNASWVERLSSVCGIYLMTDEKNRMLYVGQAGGSDGFWGRWKSYAWGQTGNRDVDPAYADGKLSVEHTKMSILTVLPLGAPKDTLHRLESRWKERLQSRFPDRGYNAN